MKEEKNEFPLKIEVGFKKVFDAYREEIANGGVDNNRYSEIFAIETDYPILSSGISDFDNLEKYNEQIDKVLSPLFPSALQSNEIKLATLPYQDTAFKSTKRYKNIMKAAGKDFSLDIIDFDNDEFYIMGCSFVLNQYYGEKIDFRRSYYYNIPDSQGMIRSYTLLYNADFVSIEKTADAPDITEKDLNELLENFDDISVWKEKFPPNSWIFKGFVIATLLDATMNVSISDFKTNLLRLEKNGDFYDTNFTNIFRSIFNLNSLEIGFTDYNAESEAFERVLFEEVDSYLLNKETSLPCKEALCNASYYTLFSEKEFYCITDAARYHALYPDNPVYKKMLDQGVKSAIFASIIYENRVLGVLELVSPEANVLNTINANKLRDIMPFVIDTVVRSKRNLENELELIIQEECTALHPSVHWKFRREAKLYLNASNEGKQTVFREVIFEDVFPLYGQTDIKGSSEARNEATKKDLRLQLTYIDRVLDDFMKHRSLPILEQMKFNINEFLEAISENLKVDAERKILDFLSSDIIPFFKHIRERSKTYEKLVDDYDALIDSDTGFVYKHRKDYDESVMLINKKLASVLDRKQQEAQAMYPHYFERFKTDGVEHNLYMGESITKERSFNKIYLNNLKLWQLQVVWEMENSYFHLKDALPINLDVASMILAFNGSLSLRFRMDEKRFDVDGTYNARYEVVKKRVDKANIKGTEERITQPGKISIIYSQKEDEEEYLKYISFLQHKKMFGEEVEKLELEDLQGVTGLKALRVNILYSKKNGETKKYYNYDDLLAEL
ncbi:GAF domain-containing protein [Aequorivita marina]|uniref:GAF domain-containing protein n=1 Tax=Aequorivita marina TaxID=3073654 RepID=UPI002875B7DC|nr:GAF domain-containing protein [Aequorivita sp. S2608]MDS1298655.1 GAF domain-containing protein [Aequorivita sp. S2608]